MNKDIKVSELKHSYSKFSPTKAYLDSMPDLQNSDYKPTVPIERVGIHGFHLPLRIREQHGGYQEVMTSWTGTVSLEADKAGINMSRILRTAYKSADDEFDIDRLCKVLEDYKRDLDSFESHLTVKFSYRMWQESLRSVDWAGTPNGGWQYYDVTFDVDLDKDGKFRKVMYLDFVYSSACPCSTALSEHAALSRGVYGIPHSQRSVAKVGIEFDQLIWIEDLVEDLREALKTETLVFCKREDEQAFAELNGANVKFVEDAARTIAQCLDANKLIKDYKIVLSHLESLHSHDAIAVIIKGLPNSKFTPEVSYEEFQALKR